MGKAAIIRVVMTVLGTGLSVVGSIINAKNQDMKMKETIAAQVAEALKNQTKES